MKKNKFLLILNLICIAIVMASTISHTVAWIVDGEVEATNLSGSSVGGYFGGGDGSKEKPYIINDSRHLYNLAWLQYYGRFNKTDADGTNILSYFKVNNDIDMTGFAIPPIGTTEYPFTGVLDAAKTETDNYSIKNCLTTTNETKLYGYSPSNNYDYLKTTNVGFFGDTASGSKVTNLFIVNSNIEAGYSQSSTRYIGTIAGKAEGTFSTVYVVNSTLSANVGFTTLYNLFGYSSNLTAGSGVPSSNNLLDATFDANKFINTTAKVLANTDLSSNKSFYNEYKDSGYDWDNDIPYNPNVFDIYGQFKLRYMTSSYGYDPTKTPLYEESWFLDKEEYNSYLSDSSKTITTYSGQSVSYQVPSDPASSTGIQFQANNSGGNANRCVYITTTGAGKIFLVGSGNADGKKMALYDSTNALIETVAFGTKNTITGVGLNIPKAGTYKLAANESNTYVYYMRFIISSNYGDTSGEQDLIFNCDYTYEYESTYATDKIDGYIYGGLVLEIVFSNTDTVSVNRTSSTSYIVNIQTSSSVTIYNSKLRSISYTYNSSIGTTKASKLVLSP